MIGVYCDTLRGDDGTHLDGSIADNKFWQELYQRVIASVLPLYSPPSGPIATEFLPIYTQLFTDVCERR